MDITILGIESSCDDTSAAVIRNTTLLSNVIASQEVHRKYGGVIPELASRAHQQNIIPVVDTALKEAGITKLPNLYALKTEYKKLDAERERLSAQYSEAKQKLKEYGIVKQNVDSILRTAPGKEHTQER